MIYPQHFREYIVRPALRALGLHSAAAENLLVGTAVQESHLTYLVQHNGGTALGLYQIEPATHEDLFDNWKAAEFIERRNYTHLVWDMSYATAIARLIYYRRPESLPDAEDVDGLAAYWKEHYNTPLGKGTAPEWALNYRRYCQ
jgi:hypothetical protein